MNAFKTSVTSTIPNGSALAVEIQGTFKLMSVVMTLGASLNNDFTIDLIRDGITHRIYAPPTATYQTITWLLEGGGIVLTDGDVLSFANSAVTEGSVFFSYEESGESGPQITITPAINVDGAAGPAI